MTGELVITFAAPAESGGRDPVDALLLEQAEMGSYSGHVTRGQIVGWLRSMMYGYEEPEVDCGLDSDGGVNTAVLVYPYDPALAYRLALSHGELGELVVEEVEFVELVHLTPDRTTADLKYPAQAILAAEWIGDGYDGTGAAVPVPAVTVDGLEITLARPVYGALKVTYRVVVHGYAVTLPAREKALDNRWSSVAYAWWDGGVKWLSLELPDGINNMEEGQPCGWSSTGTARYPDDEIRGPQGDSASREIIVDYCTQTIKT